MKGIFDFGLRALDSQLKTYKHLPRLGYVLPFRAKTRVDLESFVP